MLRTEIERRIKARLEELSPFDEPAALVAIPTSDVKPVDSYITESLVCACDDVLSTVSLHLVRQTVRDIEDVDKTIEVHEGVGYVDIPPGFLRLHTVRFDGWARDVKSAITPDSPLYPLQRNRYTRGGAEKPVVAVNDGRFEIYSVAEGDRCSLFRYIPMTCEGFGEIEDSIAEMVILRCAVLVLKTFSEFDKAKTLGEELAVMMTSKALL